jgi:hypothetical protein
MTLPERVTRLIDPDAPPAPPTPLYARVAPWLTSGAIHAALAGGAFFIAWNVIPVDRPASAIVSFDDPAFAPAPEPPLEPPPEDAPTFVPETALPDMPALPDTGAPVALGDALADVPTLPTLDSPPPPAPITESVRDVTFAGLGASDARDIVYIVDFSGAMITAFPDIVRELERSAGALHPTQRFQVILIRGDDDDGVTYAPFPPDINRPILIDATWSAKQEVFEWLEEQRPRGGTNLLTALETALDMRPDAVFLLARFFGQDRFDAEADQILTRLDRLNPADAQGDRPVTIKTIQILREDPTGLMRAIGRAHGGDNGYKFVTLDELSQAEPPPAAPIDPER